MNRLSDATSPYLLQHADNPVHWWPWSAEALEAARESDRPILLSVGYSACHWCHVMAHESFEDEDTATLMNALFVNIKVDREERPDLDKIYQLAHQALSRRGGGWPLTLFLSPIDQVPFFGGTYFPPSARHGLPAFRDILQGVARAWQEQREGLLEQNASMRRFLEEVSAPRAEAGAPDLAILDEAVEGLARIFDPTWGGFGGAPKFPHPPHLDLLMALGTADDERGQRSRNMAHVTLSRMARGGLFDHLGGGFCRYSVDGYWMIPHFEKMGYDNAQLLPPYAVLASHDDDCRRTAIATGEWVMRELQGEDGGYLSSWDADSEGEEGRYYLWTPDQVKGLVNAEEWQAIAPLWGLDRPPNFEGKDWHLHGFESRAEAAERLGIDDRALNDLIDSVRCKLLAVRSTRVPPGCDDKILTSWNGLMIAGMAAAGRRLGRADFIASAQAAADFIRNRLWVDDQLLATFRQDQARLNAYLDDHAFMAWGLSELLQASWREEDLAFATDLIEAMLARFQDAEHGGFLFTSHDHESLIQRPRPFQDDALPSGNAMAARALTRFGHLLAEPRLLEAAERTLSAGWPEITQAPHAYCGMLLAALDFLQPATQLILRGAVDTDTASGLAALPPRDTVYHLPEHSSLADRYRLQGPFTAYLCQGTQCGPPLRSVAALRAHWD